MTVALATTAYNFVVHELDLEELREIYKICKLLGPRAVRLAAASIPRSS
jgi:DNA-binding GntR family transcriptional regulator